MRCHAPFTGVFTHCAGSISLVGSLHLQEDQSSGSGRRELMAASEVMDIQPCAHQLARYSSLGIVFVILGQPSHSNKS